MLNHCLSLSQSCCERQFVLLTRRPGWQKRIRCPTTSFQIRRSRSYWKRPTAGIARRSTLLLAAWPSACTPAWRLPRMTWGRSFRTGVFFTSFVGHRTSPKAGTFKIFSNLWKLAIPRSDSYVFFLSCRPAGCGCDGETDWRRASHDRRIRHAFEGHASEPQPQGVARPYAPTTLLLRAQPSSGDAFVAAGWFWPGPGWSTRFRELTGVEWTLQKSCCDVNDFLLFSKTWQVTPKISVCS